MTKLELWNMALAHLRAAPVGDMSEMTAQAIACRSFYSTVKGQVLESAPWRFATSWLQVPELAEASPVWAHVYQVPAETVRVWAIAQPGTLKGANGDPPACDMQWAVFRSDVDERPVIGANQSPIMARVTLDVDEPRFTGTALFCLSYLLAFHMAVPLQGSETGMRTQKIMMQMYTNSLKHAEVVDSSPSNPRQRESRLLRARG